MPRFKTIAILFFFFFQSKALIAQKLLLDGPWRFSAANDSAFSALQYDDTKWTEKSAGHLLFKKEELNPKSGFVWIRKTIVIPSSLKKELSATGALAVFLGRIYQEDVAFFNGKLIGTTNSSDIKRTYILKQEEIHWDAPNAIAIKMQHWGDVCGLETTAPPYISSALPSAVFSLSSSADGVQTKQPVKGKQAVYRFTVNNNAGKKVSAMVTADFYDMYNKRLYTDQKNITLSAGSNTISFPYTSSSSFLKATYRLSLPEYAYHAEWNDEFGYNDVVYKPADAVIADKIKAHFTPASIKQQVITGWLGQRMDANEKERLYQVDEAAILAGYINRPGSHPWIGEHVGKFLDAASNTYKNKGDAALKVQLDRTAQQLIAAQMSDGYLGTYTADNYWTSWDVWSHKYNIIGLLSYYSLSGYQPALNAAKRAGDLLCKTFGYEKGQLDIIKAGTHVGMASTSVLEPMVDLYRYTGDKKYLDFCYYIIKSYDQANGPKIISTLNATGGRVDKTANAKAYEMLSNLVGIIKLYSVTGDETFLHPVLLAWNDIVNSRLYITGAASSFEHFKDDGDLPASDKDNMGEGCVTTTWIQLNYQLLCITGEMKYVNELERAVYNHLAGAENPESGCVSYYTPLVGVKPYRCVITCCMSSVPRGIAMIPLFANGKINNHPSFLFYQPGTYTTTDANNAAVSFTTVTNFPSDGNIAITINNSSAAAYPVEFRKPYWAESFSLSVNGKKQAVNNTETVTVNRAWKKGDHIAVSFAMPLMVLDGGKSYPGQLALQRGPQVLAFDKSLNDVDADQVAVDPKNMQLQMAAMLPAQWVGGEAFQIKGSMNNAEKHIMLVPFADAGQTSGAITTWIKKTN